MNRWNYCLTALAVAASRRWRLFLLLSLPGLLAACAGVPTAQLQAYSSSYDELRTAASLVYADAAPAIAAADSTNQIQFPATLGPPAFDREGCGVIVASHVSLRARCQTMLTAKAYNQALLDLSSGKSVQDVLGQVDNAVKSLSTLAGLVPIASMPAITGLEPLLGPLKSLLEEALKARDRELLRAALQRGEPTLQKFIHALRTDVDELYKVHRAYAEARLQKIKNSIDGNINPAFKSIADHAPPTDQVVVLSLRILQDKFEEVFFAPEPRVGLRLKAISFATTASSRPLDQASIQVIDRQLLAASEDVSKFKSVGEQYKRSVQALQRFDTLISAWDTSLSELSTASAQPFATGGGTQQVVLSLVAVRDQARAIRLILGSR